MSEFSASYHLKAKDKEQAIKLIKDAGHQGFVFNEINGWVTFLIKGQAFDISESVIQCNPGLLVHYTYAEDHGWEFRVFEKDRVVFEYTCDWTDELHIEKNVYNLDVIKKLISSQGHEASNLEEIFEMDEYDYEHSPAYQLAEKIGLVHYEWLSADYIRSDDELEERGLIPVE